METNQMQVHSGTELALVKKEWYCMNMWLFPPGFYYTLKLGQHFWCVKWLWFLEKSCILPHPKNQKTYFKAIVFWKAWEQTSGKENVTEEETQVMSISSTQVSSWLLTHNCMVQTQSSCDDSKITELRVEM